MSDTSPDPVLLVSVVIPVYNPQEEFLDLLRRLEEFLTERIPSHEVIVVDDGSLRGPLVAAVDVGSLRTHLVRLPENRGKGDALRKGMAVATGDIRLFTDADLPYGVEGIDTMVQMLCRDEADIVIGDRTLPDSTHREHVSPLRRLSSTVFAILFSRFLTPGIRDTQCGIKGFGKGVAPSLFPLTRSRRFAIDVEILHLAMRSGLRLQGMPVRQVRSWPSTLVPWRELGRTLLELAGIFWRSFRRRGGEEERSCLTPEPSASARPHSGDSP